MKSFTKMLSPKPQVTFTSRTSEMMIDGECFSIVTKEQEEKGTFAATVYDENEVGVAFSDTKKSIQKAEANGMKTYLAALKEEEEDQRANKEMRKFMSENMHLFEHLFKQMEGQKEE